MKFSSNIHVETELAEGRDFYQTQVGKGLAADFLEEYNRLINLLLRYPQFGTPLDNMTIRKQPMKRFPYNIIYRVNGEGLRILAVAHQSRKPKYWLSRA
jgi:plasmid stabilization system protein ParE